MKPRLGLVAAALVTFTLGIGQVYALEINITDNGGGSDNTVETQVTTETSVEQKNETTVNNEVDVEADTGNNQANGNTGEETNIETGDVEVEVELETKVNHTETQVECCETGEETTLTISGNGEGSTNNIEVAQNTSTTVDVEQTAYIKNMVNGTAVTGNNTANNNNGNVSIITGNIQAIASLKNQANTANIEVCCGATGDVSVRIKNNGSGSINLITYKAINDISVEKRELAKLINDVNFILLTGGNQANGNNGDVSITTGDIFLAVNVKNDPINDNIIKVGCCDEEPVEPPVEPPIEPPIPPILPPEKPVEPPVQPPTSPGNGNGGDGGSSSAGEVLGSSDDGGDILPATGTTDYLLLILANIAMLLLGSYLRLRSGRSPAK